MAENIDNTIKTTVKLDADQAQQEIVKLNSLASDGTEDLSKRLEAKNKQIRLQNDLNKKAIADLEKEIRGLTGVIGKEKELARAQKKLTKAKLNEVKVNVRNEKAQKKLKNAYDDSKSSINKLNDATGGFVDKLKLLATNPIILVMTALVGVFQLLKSAVARSEKATASFAKVGAFLSGMLNGVIAVLEPLVELLGDALVKAIEKPGEAWDDFVGVLQSGYEIWKTQILDRFLGNLKILSGTFEKGILKMRIAWNEFTGDHEEADSLLEELDKVNEKIEEGLEAHRIANQQLIDGYNSAKEAAIGFAKKAKEGYDEAAESTLALAGAERQLVKNRIALEKQQLTSLKLAEEQRQIRDDISKSFEERIAANKQLGDVLENQSKRELAIAQQNLDIAHMRQQADGQTIESIEAIGDAEIKLLEIQERITGQRSEQLVNEQALKKEQADKVKADEDKAAADKKIRDDADEVDRLKKEADKKEADKIDREQRLVQDEIDLQYKRDLGEATLKDELEFLEKKRLQDTSAADLRGSEIDTINKKYAKKKSDLEKAALKAQKAADQAALDSIIGMAGDAFGISKELAIAKMLMNAPEAIGNVWTEAGKQPTLPQVALHGIAGTSMVVAPIVKGLATIKSTKFSKGSGGRGGGGSINTSAGGGTGSVPTATTTEVSDLSSINQARLGADTSLGNQASQTASANVQGGASGRVVFSESSYKDFQNQIVFKEDKSTL